MKVALAVLVVFTCFFVYSFFDVRVITSKDTYFNTLLSIWPLFFFFLTAPIAIYWGYRVVYVAVGEQIWVTFLVNGLTMYCAYLFGTFIGSGQLPTKNQAIALVLKGIALIIATL